MNIRILVPRFNFSDDEELCWLVVVDMSSTKIRTEIEKGNWEGLKDILDPAVMAYMQQHGLTFKQNLRS